MARPVVAVVMLAVSSLAQHGLAQDFMEVLTTFIGLDGAVNETATIFDLAHEAFAEEKRAEKENYTFMPVDDAYPIAENELHVLQEFFAACRTAETEALQTWCTGRETYLDEEDKEDPENVLCPHGIITHPCSGRVMKENRGLHEVVEYYWPWEGIKCNAYTDPPTITSIYLPDEHLRCQLNDFDFASMVSLQQLDLSKNELTGSFPTWLSDMPALRLLNLSNSQLSGVIPLSFADNNALEVVDLSKNKLTAPTLGFLKALRKLRYLDLSQNKFAVHLAPELFQSEFLHTINISRNQFYGPLPEMSPPKYIVAIDVSFNNLTGELPQDLSAFGREDPRDPDEESSLTAFMASHNGFSGSVPNISNLTSLQQLKAESLLSNQFKCPVLKLLSQNNVTCECSAVRLPPSSAPAASSSSGNDGSGGVALVEGADGCSYCASGFHSNGSTNHECRACPTGTFSVSLASDSSFNSSNEYCTPCQPGTFGNETQMAQCHECPKGTITSDFGMTKCEKCFPGYFANGSGLSECSPCAAGSFSDKFGQDVCQYCPPGSYTAVKGEAECLLCPIGSYQHESGRTECLPCAEGFVAPFPGHSVCVACPAGSTFDKDASTCRKCPPNKFSSASAQLQCLNCPDGMGADGFGNSQCFLKPKPGYGLDVLPNTSSHKQVLCDPGFFNDRERLTCEPCAPGTFSAKSGSVKCSPCAKGSFSGRKESTRCELAPIGTFADREGAWKPQRCPPNHFSSITGSSRCVECPWPSFSLVGGSSSCSSAEPGEVYDFVVWPRLTMRIAGISSQDLAGAVTGSSMGTLGSSWKISLAAYGVTNLELHLVTIEPQTPENDLVYVEFAVETLSKPLPKHQKRNSTAFQALRNRTAHFQQFMDATRLSFENTVGSVVDTLKQTSNGYDSNNNNTNSGNNNGSSVSDQEDESSALRTLIQGPGFLETFVRQLYRDGVADVSSRVVRVDVLTSAPLKSSRAVKCPRGTYFAALAASVSPERSGGECRLCPLGTFSDTEGALSCTPCPKSHFADEEGLEECAACPLGDGAQEGASACVTCGWFTYACEGFWDQVLLVSGLCTWYSCKLWTRYRRVARGDSLAQQQSEQMALLATARTHGRTCASVLYEPMGEVSADTMWSVDNALQ